MASYNLEIKKSVLKDLKKLDKKTISAILRKTQSLRKNPRHAQSQKLKGTDNSFRLRVGNYRIIYQIDHASKTIHIYGIGHRKEIYRTP